ncbi:hypothetical protein GCM10010424_22490 [Streptomyces lienomycini]
MSGARHRRLVATSAAGTDFSAAGTDPAGGQAPDTAESRRPPEGRTPAVRVGRSPLGWGSAGPHPGRTAPVRPAREPTGLTGSNPNPVRPSTDARRGSVSDSHPARRASERGIM